MPKYQEQSTTITGRVATAFGHFQKLLNLGGNQVCTVVHPFVQCSGVETVRTASIGTGWVF